ncbi:MAG: hypothetical protein JSR80_00950 [Verrucomicrobia bacterium]|nr:hypothetical protein [Verrucomicrobiota bacterium]
MKKFLVLVLACSSLLAQATATNNGSETAPTQVIGSAGNVDLLRQERLNTQQDHIGYTYYAQNNGKNPATVKVALEGTENVLNGLVPGAVEVNPGTTESLGWIEQKDATLAAKWRLTWKVTEQTVTAAPAK